MRVPLIAGNWKLNKTSTEAYKLVAEMLPGLRNIRGVEKLLCPPFTALMAVSRLIKDSDIRLGAQNMYWEEQGAYTGEISPRMLAEFCQYVILGHSERRTYFGESNEQVNRKVRAAIAHHLMPLICVGETLEENEVGRAAGVVSRQVREALVGLDILDAERIVIAYEPVWAIGTGRAATAAGANTLIRNVIRPTLASLFGVNIAQSVRVLYGGSVDPGNAGDFFRQPEIDGALVGGASLKARSFI
ncbi:MAG: triose-phosphate isomerase, partial [Anaerolineales bacterium]|nr:triose-phosphate isomerase [Anaerolineales bacterium]